MFLIFLNLLVPIGTSFQRRTGTEFTHFEFKNLDPQESC